MPEKEYIGVYVHIHMFTTMLFEVLDFWRSVHSCLSFRKILEIAQLKAL